MYKQKPRVELKAEGGTLGYGHASNMFGCESARMPCSIALFVVVCVLFSQQCPFSARRLRELKAAAPRSRRQESERSSPLCRERIRRPPTSAGRLGRRASRVFFHARVDEIECYIRVDKKARTAGMFHVALCKQSYAENSGQKPRARAMKGKGALQMSAAGTDIKLAIGSL